MITNANGTKRLEGTDIVSTTNFNAITDALDTVKADKTTPTFTGTVTLPSTTSIGNVDATEISYLDGVTSAIQTQIDGKVAKSGDTMTGTLNLPTNGLVVGTTQLVTSGGNVGIGLTSNIVEKLNVHNASASQTVTRFTNTNAVSGFITGVEATGNGIVWARDNTFIKFGTNAQERMRLTSGGNVGIGTTTPASKLGVRNDDSDTVSTMAMFEQYNAAGTDSAYLGIQADATNNLVKFLSDGTNTGGFAFIGGTSQERMRIDSSGNVGIGTTNPNSKLHISGNSLIQGTFIFGQTTNDKALTLSNNGTVSIINSTYGSSGASPLTFQVSDSEKMRIDASGNVLVGYTTSNGAYKLQVNSQIFATSSTIATSDGRYKENVTPLTECIELVKLLNPVSFDWKKHSVHNFDTENTTVGFIAQELEQVFADKPYLNSVVKRNKTIVVDEEGNEVEEEFLGIAEGNLIAILTKAIQELNAKVEQLEKAV